MNLYQKLYWKKYKNSNLEYYFKNFLLYALPDFIFRLRLPNKLGKLANYDKNYIMKRVNYYNKLKKTYNTDEDFVLLKNFRLKNKKFRPSTHFFDTYEITRYFTKDNKIALLFGDNIINPVRPSIVKSRPVGEENENAIILKLNKLRHFVFINDKTKFENKKDMLVGRCAIYQQNRIKFWEMYFGHPLCDLGQVSKKRIFNEKWITPYMSIDEHLKYKFILCLEGNDVATNLKWVMSSNSLAVMPKPIYETWFMEGTLIPDYHFVEIKEDYSDLPEKLNYYINNPAEAQKIIDNAHKYVEQFLDKNIERLISILVLKKYFELSK